MKKTLAIISPNQNAYSETFIQAHKKLPFNIKYYYNGYLPAQLEGRKSLIEFSIKERIAKKLKKEFSLREYALLYSLKREKVDCVLAEYGPTACESLEVIKHLKLPLVVHFHGYDASVKSVLEKYKAQYKEIFSYAKNIVVVSKQMKAALIALECPANKLFISTYGPRPEFLDNKPEYNSSQFVSVGRFVEKKAPYLTILAFKKVVEQFPNASLKMVGEGELIAVCKNIVCSLNLSKNIEFLGIKSTEEIKKIFEESIAFIQHSIIADDGDSEGTPVAVLEAQAAALPVISTFHAGITDVVVNNETGLLVQEKDVDGMANNMLRILNEKKFAFKLGQKGRVRIEENFTLQKHLIALENIINKAMSNG